MGRKNGEDVHKEHLHDWTFICCCKTATRPPVFNACNCSCFRDCPSRGEPGIRANIEAQIAEAMGTLNINPTMPMDIPMPRSSSNRAYPYNQAQTASSRSSGNSVRAPCGPERTDPGDKYLPLAPGIGHGELVHHHRAAFDQAAEEHSYRVNSWLESVDSWGLTSHGMYDHGVGGMEPPRWLPVVPRISGGRMQSIKAVKGSSKVSIESSVLLGGAEAGGRGNDLDDAHLTGQWVMGDVFDATGTLLIDDYDVDGDCN